MKSYLEYLAKEHLKEAIENENNYIENKVRISECIGGCRKKYYVLEKIKTEYVSCPFCGSKYKVRCFKNGRIDIYNLNK